MCELGNYLRKVPARGRAGAELGKVGVLRKLLVGTLSN